ncbi:MAG: type II secretion system F family protein [Bacilli bacterium]
MASKNNLIRKIYREKDLEKIERKIDMLGDNNKFDAVTFTNIRIVTSLIVFFVVLYIATIGYFFAPFFTIIYYYLFEYVLIERPYRQRIKKLDYEALYFFEILTLTIESGRNLEHALEIAVFNVESELSNEFKKTLFEMKFGKTLIEALENMKYRIPSETINNIILNITQTSVFGNSIIKTLYTQIDFLREKQILDVKGQINKIPNKISIISVLFVVPLILMLVLGPFLINFLN